MTKPATTPKRVLVAASLPVEGELRVDSEFEEKDDSNNDDDDPNDEEEEEVFWGSGDYQNVGLRYYDVSVEREEWRICYLLRDMCGIQNYLIQFLK